MGTAIANKRRQFWEISQISAQLSPGNYLVPSPGDRVPDKWRKTIIHNLRAWRIYAGLTQQNLSLISYCSTSVILEIERNRRNICVEDIYAIASAIYGHLLANERPVPSYPDFLSSIFTYSVVLTLGGSMKPQKLPIPGLTDTFLELKADGNVYIRRPGLSQHATPVANLVIDLADQVSKLKAEIDNLKSSIEPVVEVPPLTPEPPEFVPVTVDAPKVNVNTATKAELKDLPKIGPARAQDIIEARPVRDLGHLQEVTGMTDDDIQAIAKLVMFGEES